MPEVSSQNEKRTCLRSGGRLRTLAILVLACGAIALYCRSGNSPQPTPGPLPDITLPSEDDEPDPSAIDRNPGYLGPHACAPCHARRVAEFLKTPHARACRRPEDGPMPEGFEPGKGRFSTSDRALRFDMSRSGRDFLQTVERTFATGTLPARARIDLVYGANKADEVFFTWQDDQIRELMAVWLHPLQRWAHTSYDRHGSDLFARETTPRCLECHNTWISHVPGTPNEYKAEGAVLGVTCERCHGPGRQHVEHHQHHPAEKAGRDIIQPSRLARERRIEVCTQCHGNSAKPRGPVFAYRPGLPLDASFRTAVTRRPEDDHVANQIKYLRQSKCFQKSDTMTCVTCHDPHRPHDVSDSAAARHSCLQCHQPEACTDRPNLPAAVRGDCIGCHMPQRVWMNVHFHTEDERYVPPIRRFQHRIAVDRIARSEVLLARMKKDESSGLTAELVEHWLVEADRRRREHRFLAAIGAAREALRLEPPPELRAKAATALRAAIEQQTRLDADLVDAFQAAREQRITASMDLLERTLKVKPDWAVAHSKLGTLSAVSGQKDRANQHLEAVARHDPDNASGFAMLGWLADLDRRPADAVEYYRRAVEIEPYDAKLNYHWGLALLHQSRWADAAEKFRQALAVDPNHAGAFQGLSHTLREQGQSKEAVATARRAARLTRFEHPDVLATLAEAYAARGNVPEAAAAAVKALEVDSMQPGSQALSPDARRRLEELRGRSRE